MLKKIKVLFLLTILFSSCEEENKKANNNINGTWESIGSGWVLQIKDSIRYSFYDITAISCLPNRKGNFQEISESLKMNDDILSLKKGVMTYKFKRINVLPDLCQNTINVNKATDPLFNFEVFAETVKEHYAFFELNNINWEELYHQQKTKLSANPTDVNLYKILEETLEKLKDNHAYLEASEDVYQNLEKLSEPETEKSDKEEEKEYGDFQVAQMVTKHHLQKELTKDSWLIQWGILEDNIGFIQLKAMWLYADLDIPKDLIKKIGYVDAYVETFHKMYEGKYIEQEAAGVSKIMDKVMSDLSNMQSIVIDVRFNGGGQDAVSYEILSRFINGEIQVATQKLRFGSELSPMLPIYINGKKNVFNKPVYILTSPQTGSAAEAFSLASMSINHSKRIGSSTMGALSTALEKTLPNGWAFSISNEINMDLQGKQYENKGIPVHYELNYHRDRQTFFRSIVNNLDADKENILRAIKKLNKK